MVPRLSSGETMGRADVSQGELVTASCVTVTRQAVPFLEGLLHVVLTFLASLREKAETRLEARFDRLETQLGELVTRRDLDGKLVVDAEGLVRMMSLKQPSNANLLRWEEQGLIPPPTWKNPRRWSVEDVQKWIQSHTSKKEAEAA